MRPPGGGGAGSRLSKKPGLNRFTWDMRHMGPWNAATRANAPGGGPMAVPGKYTAELSRGAGHVVEMPFTLLADPKMVDDGVTVAVMKEQYDVSMQVRDLVSEAMMLQARIRDAKRRLGNAPGAPADTVRRLNAVEARLVTPPIRYSKPELLTHITYLYSLTNQADQKLGRDVTERYDFLKRELDALLAETNRILGAPPVP